MPAAVDAAGETLLSQTVANDQAALEALLDAAGADGTPALVIDQPGSIAALALAVARQHDVAVLEPRKPLCLGLNAELSDSKLDHVLQRRAKPAATHGQVQPPRLRRFARERTQYPTADDSA